MYGATPPVPQYVFMFCCLVKAQGQLYLLPLAQCLFTYISYLNIPVLATATVGFI